MNKILLPAVFALVAGPVVASEAPTCEQVYISRQGDTVESIAERAYAAPAALMLVGRNAHLHLNAGPLAIGTDMTLPCIKGVPGYAPRMERLSGERVAQATN